MKQSPSILRFSKLVYSNTVFSFLSFNNISQHYISLRCYCLCMKNCYLQNAPKYVVMWWHWPRYKQFWVEFARCKRCKQVQRVHNLHLNQCGCTHVCIGTCMSYIVIPLWLVRRCMNLYGVWIYTIWELLHCQWKCYAELCRSPCDCMLFITYYTREMF